MSAEKNEISSEKRATILKELSVSNGIQYNQLENCGTSVKTLEMFFSGYPHMIGLEYFPNLTTLMIVGQSISAIENLSYCTELKNLWICECKLTKIDNLGCNKRLSKLYLYQNEISKIENLSHLTNLDVLDLSGNHIQSIQGISSMKHLRELNLAGNYIKIIGSSFDSLYGLEVLNLSGNNISSFKDLTNLMRLPKLCDLTLKDPLYPNNPVCLLCNYSTHVLYHLPALERLDTFDVSNSQLRDLAEATVVKKKMYYNMRVKTVRRNLTTLKNRLAREKKALLQVPEKRLRAVHFALGSIEQQQHHATADNDGGELSDDESVTAAEPTAQKADARAGGEEVTIRDAKAQQGGSRQDKLEAKVGALKKRIAVWQQRTDEIEAYHDQAVDLLQQLAATSNRRLVVELETGGNVRFEQGSSADVWYSTCHDLVLSRFCAWDYKGYGITGIKMHGITRIHNRVLRGNFDDKVHAINSDENRLPNNKNYKKLVDYLFYVWNPKVPGAKASLHRILEDGFTENEMVDDAVPLSNSLYISEKPRLDHVRDEDSNRPYADPCSYRHGQVIVSKVYLGKSAPAHGTGRLVRERYTKIDSVYRPRKESNNVSSTTATPRNGTTVQPPIKSGGSDDCECSARQCEWFVFDRDLVLPEYVIDFEYFAKRPASPFQLRIGEWMSSSASNSSTSLVSSSSADLSTSSLFPDDERADQDAINLPPAIPPRPRLVSLSTDVVLKLTNQTDVANITTLNLHGNGLNRLKGINSLEQLRHLVVSFNELTRLDDVAHMSCLEQIDAGFNKINSLEGMRGMSKLKILDVGWNQLTSLRDDLTVLRKHAPFLHTLELRNNNWIKADYLFLRVVGRLKTLTTLNGIRVTEADAAAALKLVAGTRISSSTLAMNSRTDREKPNTLKLQSLAQILSEISRNKPDTKEPAWMSTVTVLNLDGQFLSKISGLEHLKNLRWASFNRNCITKLEGIETCTLLEELSLQENCIYKLDGLSKLTNLRKLDLTGNCLSSLENSGIDRLGALLHLSLDNNRITSFKSLSAATSLVELYIGNNRVTNVREIFHLKPLPSLVILDLFGNPVVQSDNYRLFVVYHLQNLKALDGNAIETSEEGSAKDAFGGRLTNDFVAERIGHASFGDVRELDFPNCSVRTVDIGGAEAYKNLRSVNLEHNSLTSFSGLIHLRHLRVLCLNHNHIECVVPRPRNHKPQIRSQYSVSHQTASSDMLQAEQLTPVLDSLEVLHLGYNRINNLANLQLSRLVNLKALFIQGNEITKVEGFDGLHELRELVLDRNKIKFIAENSFVGQWNLQELHMEENRIRDLSNLHHLENLQRLYLGMNRIQDMLELEKLDSLPNLIELSVIGNAVSRRLLHRPMLVFQQPNLQTIDGIAVSTEERAKAEMYFMDQQPIMTESILPGITPHNRAGPIKVTHMSIGTDRYLANDQHHHDAGNKRAGGRAEKASHHSLKHGALYNQLAGIKYQQQQQAGHHQTRPFNANSTSTHNRSVGSGSRYR